MSYPKEYCVLPAKSGKIIREIELLLNYSFYFRVRNLTKKNIKKKNFREIYLFHMTSIFD